MDTAGVVHCHANVMYVYSATTLSLEGYIEQQHGSLYKLWLGSFPGKVPWCHTHPLKDVSQSWLHIDAWCNGSFPCEVPLHHHRAILAISIATSWDVCLRRTTRCSTQDMAVSWNFRIFGMCDETAVQCLYLYLATRRKGFMINVHAFPFFTFHCSAPLYRAKEWRRVHKQDLAQCWKACF